MASIISSPSNQAEIAMNPHRQGNLQPIVVESGSELSTWQESLLTLLPAGVNLLSEADPRIQPTDWRLFVITPTPGNLKSVAKAIDASHRMPGKTLACFILPSEEWTFDARLHQSVSTVSEILKGNGARVFQSLTELSEFIKSAMLAGECP